VLEGFEVRKIVASVLVRHQIVVNSSNFTHYKPIGSIKQVISRLQELEVDEIAVLNLTHSENPLEDFRTLFSDEILATINTPLAYGGGITSQKSAESVIAAGCERIVLSGNGWTPGKSRQISINLGDQAVLIHLPLVQQRSEIGLSNKLTTAKDYFDGIPSDWGGELYLKDRDADGTVSRIKFFNEISSLVNDLKTPIIVGGGVSSLKNVSDLLELNYVKGVVIGNWLNRDELIIPRIKGKLSRSENLRRLVRFD